MTCIHPRLPTGKMAGIHPQPPPCPHLPPLKRPCGYPLLPIARLRMHLVQQFPGGPPAQHQKHPGMGNHRAPDLEFCETWQQLLWTPALGTLCGSSRSGELPDTLPLHTTQEAPTSLRSECEDYKQIPPSSFSVPYIHMQLAHTNRQHIRGCGEQQSLETDGASGTIRDGTLTGSKSTHGASGPEPQGGKSQLP